MQNITNDYYNTHKHTTKPNTQMDKLMECRNNLKQKMFKIIHNDLTIRRTNNNLKQFTDDELKRFIRFYADNIEEAITHIISFHQHNGNTFFEEIENVELNIIYHHLYLHVRELYELNQLVSINGIVYRRT